MARVVGVVVVLKCHRVVWLLCCCGVVSVPLLVRCWCGGGACVIVACGDALMVRCRSVVDVAVLLG